VPELQVTETLESKRIPPFWLVVYLALKGAINCAEISFAKSKTNKYNTIT
jgi:hypothetical protein